MEEQNQNSITPVVSGSLAKTNSSINITNKILSESIHEFHGDFEGKKIWESKCNDCHSVHCIGDAVVAFNRTTLYLYDKYTGDLKSKLHNWKQSITVGKDFENNEWNYYLYQFYWDEKTNDLGGDDYWVVKKTNLKDFSTSENIIHNYKGTTEDTEIKATPNNKFLLIYKEIHSSGAAKAHTEPFIYVLDSTTLSVINFYDFYYDYLAFITDKEICVHDCKINFKTINFITGEANNEFSLKGDLNTHLPKHKEPFFEKYYVDSPVIYGEVEEMEGWSYESVISVGELGYNYKYHHLACRFYGDTGMIYIFNSLNGALINKLPYNGRDYRSFCYSQDGQYFIIQDKKSKSITVLDSRSFKEVAEYSVGNYFGDTVFDPDSKSFYTLFGNGSLHKWK